MKNYQIIVIIYTIMQLSSCSSYYEELNPYNGLEINHFKKEPDPALAAEAQFIEDMHKQGFDYLIRNTNVFNSIHEFGYGFSSKSRRFASISEARAFIIETAENLLDKFNNKELQPYLKQYPVKVTDLAFMIGLSGENSSPTDISGIILLEGEVVYRQSRLKPLRPSHRESYEEAKRLYDAEQEKSKQSRESNG